MIVLAWPDVTVGRDAVTAIVERTVTVLVAERVLPLMVTKR